MASKNTTTITGTGGLDTREFASFAKALRKGAPELGKEVKAGLRTGGEIVAVNIRERASRFSTKIPPTVKVRVSSFTVSVVAGGKKAPNAEPLENETFRHPVFGNRDVWVTQKGHPYFRPAVEESTAAVQKAVLDVIDAAVHRVVLDAEA